MKIFINFFLIFLFIYNISCGKNQNDEFYRPKGFFDALPILSPHTYNDSIKYKYENIPILPNLKNNVYNDSIKQII